jgi:hypothetical protein
MASAYFAPLVTLPVIIDTPGSYRTRCGDVVTIDVVTMSHAFHCRGVYPNGRLEDWHRSGRLYAGVESDNDVVTKL